jgi:hypothetical protein
MGTVAVDFVARGTQRGAWLMVLVEEGPWPLTEVESNLRRVQERLYGCIEAAIDGKLAAKYPDSNGKEIIIRLDGYDLPESEVRSFFGRFSSAVLQHRDYASALERSEFVRGIVFELDLQLLKH